jgi:DMSO/TMAO reductase YedYZ heme-binding membrane subunit
MCFILIIILIKTSIKYYIKRIKKKKAFKKLGKLSNSINLLKRKQRLI